MKLNISIKKIIQYCESVEIESIKIRWATPRSLKTFGFWSLVTAISAVFLPTVGGFPFIGGIVFTIAIVLGAIQFARGVSKWSLAGFILGVAGVLFFFGTLVYVLNYTPNQTTIGINGAVEFGGDNRPIELINNPEAKNPSYEELREFIQTDPTDSNRHFETYFYKYVCADYAEDVHNNAEAAGIRAAWVGISFEGELVGHALNAFQATDEGLVFIDCTQWDTVAYVEEGKEYGCIDIFEADSPSYSFYEEYIQEWGVEFEPLGIVEDIQIHW